MKVKREIRRNLNCKKITRTLLIGVGIIANSFILNAQTWPPAGMGGNGTESNPWQISTAEHLAALASYVNAGNGDETNNVYYKLINDIDLSGYTTGAGWKPIGDDSTGGYPSFNNHTKFQGNFTGNGNTVRNLTINRPDEKKIGLFGRTYKANIENLGIENCNVVGAAHVGGLAGHNFYSAISGCRVSGSISGTGEGAAGGSGTYVGGLVGFNESNSTISDCYTTGIVTGIGNYVGGLAGAASISTISGCYSSCNVSGEGNGINRYGQYVGGLVGDNYNGSTIANSYATGDVTGTYRNVGGLVGSAGGTSEISNSYATGNVSGGDDNVGGLVGVSSGSINSSNKIFYSTISDCYATGNVNGSNNYVGGLVGNAGEFSIIKNCYAAGNVSGEQYIGGITGYNEGTIYNCISVNNSVIALTNTAYINRIFGAEQAYGNSYGNNYALNSMTVQSNGSNVSVINGSNAAGTGKDIATLQSHAFYNNGNNWWNSGAWSINPPSGIWKICDGENLPFLRWQGIECNDETGITDISQNTMLSIYPNPTDGIFTIDNGNLPATIKLYNMLGQEVLTQTVNGKTEININHLPQGVYNVRVFSEGKVVGNSKIMK